MERINRRLQARIVDAEIVIEQARLYEEWCILNHLEQIPPILIKLFQLRQNYQFTYGNDEREKP